MLNKYGFYESIDFTPSRLKKGEKNAIVKTYMAHHQALILLSINNLFNKKILQKRFMRNAEMQAINILLEERMPENVVITKEKKEKINKIKYNNLDVYSEKVINKINANKEEFNLMSNNNYSILIDEKGYGYSKYNNILINKFKHTSDIKQGIEFYIKNIKNKKIWTNTYNNSVEKPDKYGIVFAPDKTKIDRVDGNIETKTTITISPNDAVEIRRLEIENLGNTDETLEISAVLEPMLSTKEQEYAHPAFNNLFLNYEFIDETNTILVKRKNRSTGKNMYMAINFYSENNSLGDIEYEISKERFWRKK